MVNPKTNKPHLSRSQAEAYAFIALGLWLILKLLTFIFVPLLNILRWPLHILFFAFCGLWFYYLSLPAPKRSRKKSG